MKKFRTSWDNKIDTVEVVRETTNQVIYLYANSDSKLSECRAAKHSDLHHFFNTWKEAHEFLVRQAKRKADNARIAWDRARDELVGVELMENPEPEKLK